MPPALAAGYHPSDKQKYLLMPVSSSFLPDKRVAYLIDIARSHGQKKIARPAVLEKIILDLVKKIKNLL